MVSPLGLGLEEPEEVLEDPEEEVPDVPPEVSPDVLDEPLLDDPEEEVPDVLVSFFGSSVLEELEEPLLSVPPLEVDPSRVGTSIGGSLGASISGSLGASILISGRLSARAAVGTRAIAAARKTTRIRLIALPSSAR
jgi:hypothetical protein